MPLYDCLFTYLFVEEEDLTLDLVSDDETGWEGWQLILGNQVFEGDSPRECFAAADAWCAKQLRRA